MTKILSYNVNGIRAAMRKDIVGWLKSVNADIICLQEIKANPDQFEYQQFEDLGYYCFWYPAEKKGYSGVAILSKKKPEEIYYGTGEGVFDQEGRILRARFDDYDVLSTYHPSGASKIERLMYKFSFMEYFQDHIKEIKNRPLILSGDYNICHKSIDIHNPIANKNSSGFLPEERAWLSEFIDSGFVDSFREFNQERHQYTWWSYRAGARAKNLGWRIDYHLVSEILREKLKRSVILKEAKHSDHCPILLELYEL